MLPANPFAIPQARWMFQLGIFTLLSNSPFYYNPMPKSDSQFLKKTPFVLTFQLERNTVLWTSTQHFPYVAVPRVAARCLFFGLFCFFHKIFQQQKFTKVFMVCDSALAKDVEPRFQIYSQGRHLEDKDDLLQQPRLAGGQQVLSQTYASPPFSLFQLAFPCFA